MSQTKSGLEVTDPEAYREKVFKLLGDRDPIEVMGDTADILAGIVGQYSAEQMRTRPFPGKWTPNEIVGHLGDTEWVFGYRIRSILSEDQPQILSMDHEQWVAWQRHNEQEPTDLLETFRQLRAANLPAQLPSRHCPKLSGALPSAEFRQDHTA